MDYNAYLKKEYDKLGKKPEYYELGKVKLVIPASYRNIDDFLNDFLAFQDKEYLKYEKYNKRNPDNQIYERDIKVNDDIRLIVPLSMAKRNLSDKKIVKNVLKKAVERYKDAIEKTARLNNENPQEKAFVSLSEAHFSHCHKEHAKFVLHKMTEKLGQAMKWSGKQASDVLIGLAASPVFAAYKLLDKKYHYEESGFSRILDKEIAPRLKKALLTAAITTATTLGLKNSEKVSQFVEGVKTEIADAKQDKQLSKKYKITDEQSFANLYNASLEHIVKSLSLSEIYSPKAYSDNGKTINTIGLGSYYYPQDGNPQSSKWIRVSTYVNNNGSINVDGQKAVQLVDGWFKNRDGGRIYKNMQKVLMGAELNICEFSAIATCYYNSETAGKKFAEFVCENYDNPYTCASKLMSLTPQNEFKSGIDKRHLHEALKYLNYDDYNKKIDDMIVEKRKKSNGNTFYVTSITQLKDADCLEFNAALKNNDHEALSRITDKICSYKGKGNGVSIKSIYYNNNMDEAVSELSNHKVKTIKWNLAVNLASNLNNTH